jgi:hypothetical protein
VYVEAIGMAGWVAIQIFPYRTYQAMSLPELLRQLAKRLQIGKLAIALRCHLWVSAETALNAPLAITTFATIPISQDSSVGALTPNTCL